MHRRRRPADGPPHRLDIQLQPPSDLLLRHTLHHMQVADLGPLGHPDHLRVLLVRSTRRPCLAPAAEAGRSSSAWRCRLPTVVRPAARSSRTPVLVERMVERPTGHREVADEAIEAALVTPLLLLVFGGRGRAGGTTCDVISSNEIYLPLYVAL